METVKQELEELSKAYRDTPENEEQTLIPFVKKLLKLPMKERQKLLPDIRELQWIKNSKGNFKSMTYCDRDRSHFLAAVQFVCANKREIDMAYHINFDLICKVLPLYCPTWFTDFINEDKSWSNRGLKKEITGWAAGLFETLQPTTEELLSLQKEMIQVFTSSYTRVRRTGRHALFRQSQGKISCFSSAACST
ncbi:MAG: hypothetical protein K2L60_00995 [Bacteroides sp.]|nr:hypothetical protein [Bacteroides sp.]